MLTADLVEVRRRGSDLSLRPLTEEERQRAQELGQAYLALVAAHLGSARGELLEACRAVPFAPRERRLALGLQKLVLDGCEFEASETVPPDELRADLFARAAAHRRALTTGATFDRQALLTEVAAARGLASPAEVEQALYADLPEAHRLVRSDVAGPVSLLAAYEDGAAQAVLLRAVRVVVRFTGASPAAYRHLFRRLKFLRLLHTIEPLPARPSKPSVEKPGAKAPRGTGGRSADKSAEKAPPPGYLITIDGPYSLFDSVTKYGLQLALAYPAIAACGRFLLEADVRWGKERRPLRFVLKGGDPDDPDTRSSPPSGRELPPLPPEVEALREAIDQQDGWRARPCARLVDLPGAGVLVPDLEIEHQPTGKVVLCEVLGFWSRQAVWRRIELAAAGLPLPMLFAVSKHLRVSEEALPDDLPAALHVYAHTISPRALLDRARQLLGL